MKNETFSAQFAEMLAGKGFQGMFAEMQAG
jgi:hypothetical protein